MVYTYDGLDRLQGAKRGVDGDPFTDDLNRPSHRSTITSQYAGSSSMR